MRVEVIKTDVNGDRITNDVILHIEPTEAIKGTSTFMGYDVYTLKYSFNVKALWNAEKGYFVCFPEIEGKQDQSDNELIPTHPVGYVEAAPNTEEAYHNESCDSHVLAVEVVLDRDRDTEDLNDPATQAVLEVCKRAHRQGIKDLIVDYS